MIERWISLVVAGFIASLGACFTAPDAPVLFACDPQNAPACPEGYECRNDGCCHRQDGEAGSPGACRLGGGADTEAETGSEEAGTDGTDPIDRRR